MDPRFVVVQESNPRRRHTRDFRLRHFTTRRGYNVGILHRPAPVFGLTFIGPECWEIERQLSLKRLLQRSCRLFQCQDGRQVGDHSSGT